MAELTSQEIGVVVRQSLDEIRIAGDALDSLRRIKALNEEVLGSRESQLFIMPKISPAVIAAAAIYLHDVSEDEALTMYADATKRLAYQWRGDAIQHERESRRVGLGMGRVAGEEYFTARYLFRRASILEQRHAYPATTEKE